MGMLHRPWWRVGGFQHPSIPRVSHGLFCFGLKLALPGNTLLIVAMICRARHTTPSRTLVPRWCCTISWYRRPGCIGGAGRGVPLSGAISVAGRR